MNKPRMIGLRIYLCLSGTLTAIAILRLGAGVFAAEDFTAQAVAALLLLTICTLGVADTLVNDVFSDRWKLEWSKSWRHDGYVALAVANLALIFVAANRGVEGEFLFRFALDAAMAVYVAFRDIQLRYVEPRQESRTHVDHHA